MYELLKNINETTKIALKDNRVYVLKKITFDETEIYKKLIGLDNKNIVKFYEIIVVDDDFYVVCEYINGQTLKSYIENNGTLNDEKTKEFVLQICNGLSSIHALGIVHRDINPNNIMVDSYGVIKIIDFGISRIEKRNQTTDTQILGTQGYAAPEQFGFHQTNQKADIYSLGVVINFLKTGTTPNEKSAKGFFSEIINKCTQIDEISRYDSINELVSAITNKNKAVLLVRKIPGFRTLVWWKTVIASIYYLFVLFCLIGLTSPKNKILTTVYNWGLILFLFIVPLIFIFDFNDWSKKFVLTKNKSKTSKTIIKIIFAIISLIISLVFLYLSEN